MLDPTKFKRNRSAPAGPKIDEWFCGLADRDLEIMVMGNDEGPSAQHIGRAEQVLQRVDELKERAISLLREFMKDQGTWCLNTVDCGFEAERQQCDFLLSFTFEADGSPWEYTYTYFNVAFVIHERSHSADRYGRPSKFIVGFH